MTERKPKLWRLIFVVYALALTTATHWPNLVLGPQIPASDKLLHLAAFGLLAILLWKTRWIRSRWAVVLIAVAWAMLDETTQAIPILRRWTSPDDLFANVLGVVVAGMWLWALGVKSTGLSVRSTRTRLAAAIWPGILLVTGVAVAFTVIGASSWAHRYALENELPTWHPLSYSTWFGHLPRDLKQIVDLTWLLIVGAVAVGAYRARLDKLAGAHVRCVSCGHDLRGTPMVDGAGRCGECGAGFRGS